jgi:lipopolysaccharide export system protein LptA
LIPRISILFLAIPLLHAQEPEDVVKKSPIALLPNGSVLQGVLLPRYDAQRNLVGDLRAETMTLIDGDRVQGENVLIKFYNQDRSIKGKVALTRALFNQAKSILSAKEPVEITNDRLTANGSGLIYSFQKGKGFLLGPATTRISATPPATTMNMKSITTPAAAAILSLATATANADPPAYVSPEELAAIKADAETAKPALTAANKNSQEQLASDIAAGDKAAAAAKDFVKDNGIKTVATENDAAAAPAKPLEVKPGPNDTIITCDGGMFFDADAGVLVYLDNVTVTDPRFDLSGANELKIFFDKKPEEKADKPKQEGDAVLGGSTVNFGDVKKIVGSGAVRILQKGVAGKAPVEASGAVLTYDVPKGEIIIHGGFPWVKQDKFFARAKEPNLTLRLLNDGSFSTQGNWEMGGNLNLKGN